MGDLPRWKNTNIFQSDLIIMGDCPYENKKIFQSDLIVMGDCPHEK
jgi:hypothetical protein